MKILIADTSPLISLMLTDKLNILFDLYPQVYIPASVWNELKKHPGITKYESDINLLQTCVTDVHEKMFFPEIDEGESDAISLYLELHADVLLIDDKKGRQIAEQKKVNCIGTLALLIAAKDRSLLSQLRPVFSDLLANNRYYQKDLLNKILSEKGETHL